MMSTGRLDVALEGPTEESGPAGTRNQLTDQSHCNLPAVEADEGILEKAEKPTRTTGEIWVSDYRSGCEVADVV